MGRVSCFLLPGKQLWFHSLDHSPPHFHAKKAGEWEYRVFFLLSRDSMLERKWQFKAISRKDAEALLDLSERFRFELLEEWELKVQS